MNIKHVTQHHPSITVLIPAACGCKPINPRDGAYIYSHANGKHYCDIVCMVQAEQEWYGDLVKVGDTYFSLEAYKTLEEVEEYG